MALAPLAPLLLLASCATEPVTGRRQLMLTSQNDEREQAAEMWSEISATKKQCPQPQLQRIVQEVGARMARQADATMRNKWSFHLFQDREANAFCLPDGHVCIYDGIFLHVRNEAELAAVIGHEIGHVVARHGSERMSQEHLVDQGKLLLTTALGYANSDQTDLWVAAYTGIANVGFLYPYSRRHEYIADRMALLFMARAGYAPEAALEFWSRFSANHGGNDGISQFTSTHPSDVQRVEHLKLILPEAQSIYRVSENRGYGARFTIQK